MAEKPRLRVPSEAKTGDIIQIKTLMSHVMETGFRKDDAGKPIPREIINSFVCTFNGHEVFRADLEPAISANPYFEFTVKMAESGTFDKDLPWPSSISRSRSATTTAPAR
jgi:sulfur-oxidizing protein SoxZ